MPNVVSPNERKIRKEWKRKEWKRKEWKRKETKRKEWKMIFIKIGI